jgi:hypothetical protein
MGQQSDDGVSRLAAAVIDQAWADFKGDQVQQSNLARQWFLSDDAGAFSFLWCLQALDQTPNLESIRSELAQTEPRWAQLARGDSSPRQRHTTSYRRPGGPHR